MIMPMGLWPNALCGAEENDEENKMKFHIVSDSSCDLGRETARELGITMVSFYAQLGDDVYYREEQDISTHDFYQRMADHPGVYPKTSMPTMDDYLQAIMPHVEQGMPVLCICLNAAFSGSCQAARNVREEILEDYPNAQVYVMDSRCATVLQGALVEEAVALRDQGCTLEEAVQALEAVRDSGRIFFTANDLDYLRQGGRIGAAAAATGSLLKVKPLIGYENAGLVTDGIAQGRKKSLARVQELFFRYVEKHALDLSEYRVVTGFGLDRAEYDKFTDEIWQGFAQRGMDVARSRPYQIGITIGVHTGPTPIGVGLLKRAKRP